MPRRIVERRIHQHDIGAVGRQPGRGKGIGAGGHVKHDAIGRNRVGAGVAARKFGERRIDLDQHELDSGHAPGQRKAGGADTGAKINHAIARARRRRRGQQHGIVAGAVTRFRLPQAQLSAKKGVLGEIAGSCVQSSARSSWTGRHR